MLNCCVHGECIVYSAFAMETAMKTPHPCQNLWLSIALSCSRVPAASIVVSSPTTDWSCQHSVSYSASSSTWNSPDKLSEGKPRCPAGCGTRKHFQLFWKNVLAKLLFLNISAMHFIYLVVIHTSLAVFRWSGPAIFNLFFHFTACQQGDIIVQVLHQFFFSL